MNALLYSKISDVELFARVGFYRDDIKALATRFSQVASTNKIFDIFKHKPDFVLAYFYSYSVFAGVAAKLVGSKLIYTGGADQISPLLTKGYKLKIRQVLAFFCLCLADRVVVSCTDDEVEFRKISMGFSWLANKIHLANHVVDVSKRSTHRKRFDGKKVVAFTLCWLGVASNAYRKGIDRAIVLMKALKDFGLDVELIVAGTEGAGVEYVNALSSQQGLSSEVKYIGSITEEMKFSLFAECDIYLQLSRYEGFGVAAAEAMLSGMLVLHSNAGGLKDIIGSNGVVLDFDKLEKDINYIPTLLDSLYGFEANYCTLNNIEISCSINSRAEAFLKNL